MMMMIPSFLYYHYWHVAFILLPFFAAFGFAPKTTTRSSSLSLLPLSMVRNIDLPECLVFYGLPDKMLLEEPSANLISLLQECKDTDTAVLVIPASNDNDNNGSTPLSGPLSWDHLPIQVHRHVPKSKAPNPWDLYEALNKITIRPRPFGGSSGFASRQFADPERTPLAARTVVLCQTVEQTRAARACGMRVLCFTDNDLADVILSDGDIDFYLDDIATPGSFWLNPPSPRDDDGNMVDVEKLIEYYKNEEVSSFSSSTSIKQTTAVQENQEEEEEMSDEELQRILGDLSPLK